MHDHVGQFVTSVLIAVLTAVSALWTGAATGIGVLAQSADPLTAWVPGIATLLGLAALVWRLVTDTRNANRQDARYEKLIDELQSENARLRRLLAEQDNG